MSTNFQEWLVKEQMGKKCDWKVGSQETFVLEESIQYLVLWIKATMPCYHASHSPSTYG